MGAFDIENRVTVSAGVNGLDSIYLNYDAENSAEVYLNGGHLTAWRSQGKDMLFLSEKACFEEGKAIRGGMPVIFPQFGPGLLKNHGFARNELWQVGETRIDEMNRVCLTLVLEDSDRIKSDWAYSFRLSLEFVLDHTMKITMKVENIDSKPLEFTCALHTYFAIGDIEKTWVQGLKGVTFFDALRDGHRSEEAKERVTFREEYDRVYQEVPDLLTIVDNTNKRNIEIKKSDGFRDAVVWNPWVEKSKGFKDFDDQEYKRMLCVEAGLIGEPKVLKPREQWQGTQLLSATYHTHG